MVHRSEPAEGGAVNKASAAKIRKVYGLAIKNGAPVIGIYDSKGGDISEGAEMLDAYSDIACASAQLSGVVPQISLVAGICAGTAAMTDCTAKVLICLLSVRPPIPSATIAANPFLATSAFASDEKPKLSS